MNADDPCKAGPAAGLSAQAASEVVAILEDYLRDLERGCPPHPDDLVARYPELAEVLRAYLGKLEVLHQATVGLRDPGPAGEADPADAAPAPGRLGDFLIMRQVGRGGMGIVYEAEQISLGRRVALKVLPFATTLDAKQLQRFKNEAQAAAHLHHTHIVPVYAVGTDRGVHYYAMQFIEGQTLAAVIAALRRQAGLGPVAPTPPGDTSGSWPAPEPPDFRLPDPADVREAAQGTGVDTVTEPQAALATLRSTKGPAFFQTAAQLGVQAAEALEHAHQAGVVHRDVKPANLLVDGRGHLWVTDFGLARYGGEPGLTRTGDLVGTLHYMSPEQALGKRFLVDPRTDVYALGATLYELLTLEPAYAGRDREELLRQIAFEEPRLPRRLNRAIPAELETIVLKAMGKSLEERYATAQELADDLRRFLEDKPIKARRPTLRARAAKWARRHRPLVRAIVGLVVVALVALAAGAVLLWREHENTKAALARAEEEQRLARQVVDEMFTEVAEEWLEHEPRQQQRQRQFLLKALAHYQRFARVAGAGPEVRREAGRAALRVGDIHQHLGDFEQARPAYAEAIRLFEQLAADFPDIPTYRADLAACTNSLGILLARSGPPREAEDAFRRAVAIQERLAAEAPNVPGHRNRLAAYHRNLAVLLMEAERKPGWHREAEQSCLRALALCEQLAAANPADVPCQVALASAHDTLGTLCWDTGRLAEAERNWRRALAVNQPLADRYPDKPAYTTALAGSEHQLGSLLLATDRPTEAEPVLRGALALAKKLADDFPHKLEHRAQLARCYLNLAILMKDTGRAREAEEVCREALTLQRELVDRFPASGAFRRELAGAHNNLGILLKDTGRLPEAAQAFNQAMGFLPHANDDSGQAALTRCTRADYEGNLGSLYWAMGRLPEAEQAYRRALAFCTGLVEDFPTVPAYRNYLARASLNLGHLLWGAGRLPEAEQAYRKALAAEDCPGADPPPDAFSRLKGVESRYQLGQLLWQTDRLPEAQEEFGRVARDLSRLLDQLPDHPGAHHHLGWFLATCPDPALRDPGRAQELAWKAVALAPEVADCWNTLGAAHYRAGHYEAAVAALEKAAGLRPRGNGSGFFFLAMAHWRLGKKEQASRWYDRGVQELDQDRLRSAATARFRAEAAALLDRDHRPP
jgi:serine/threonine protein kinase/Tfp pilus assembly protein PilF